jgi:hypothetical protein
MDFGIHCSNSIDATSGQERHPLDNFYEFYRERLAEAVRFELTEGFPLRWFSRPVP